MGELLSKINSIEDLSVLPEDKLDDLCGEIRELIIDSVAENGGHLASSLGAVELIVAMHRVYSSPDDVLLFDVGHQAYAHKILTGRRDEMNTLRKEGGISGFPKREESPDDAFNTGHASTSVSAALGLVRAKKMQNLPGDTACLIGDGALTGGLAYEALDDGGDSKLPLVVILNDNEMSISRNVGAMSRSLTHLRAGKSYNRFKQNTVRILDKVDFGGSIFRRLSSFKNRIKRFILSNTFFEELGFTYLGPIDGHNIHELIHTLSEAKRLQRPVLVHTVTQKGRGYGPAEQHPERFHGVGPFDKATGELRCKPRLTCSQVFGEELCRLAEADNRIAAITAAMPEGTGLDLFATKFNNRFFDVGIAEEHAVTMAAGMAAGGMRPVVAVYSSFMQRGTDEIFHDVCLQNLPVVFALDRAGLVGPDGETHNGLLDVSLFYDMPNIEIIAPSSFSELRASLSYAVNRDGPAVLRYNKGTLPEGDCHTFSLRWQAVYPVKQYALISYGSMLSVCTEIMPMFSDKCGLVSASSLKPMDSQFLSELEARNISVMVIEEGPPVLARQIALTYPDLKLRTVHLPTTLIQQGTIQQQRAKYGLDADSLAKTVHEWMESV